MNKQQTIAVTGASGFVGEIVCHGLRKAGYKVVEYDCYGGWVYRLLNKKFFMPASLSELTGQQPSRLITRVRSAKNRLRTKLIALRLLKDSPVQHIAGSTKILASLKLRKAQIQLLKSLLRLRVIRRKPIDILERQVAWIERFRNIDAIVHLAAIPHPNVPGMTETDFKLVNYWGSVNIFEAARQAGVKKFIFASSGQVYDINQFKRWTGFPVVEEEADGIQQSSTVHPYSRLKWEVEKFLESESSRSDMVSIALRLEFPGILGGGEYNLWLSTSCENLQDAFAKSIKAKLTPGCYKYNICDEIVPLELGNVQESAKKAFPDTPSRCTGNQCLWSIEKAKREIGYSPKENGSYYHINAIFS